MADVALHPHTEAFEPPIFRTSSKKLGMWLFLMSDSLTFGALLFAYSYGRISTPGWPTPFKAASIINATIMTVCLLSSSLTMVLAVNAARHHRQRAVVRWMLATMFFGAAFVVLHAREWSKLGEEGMGWFKNPWGPSQFGGTFFTLTGMHMLHVTLGVFYLGAVALRWLDLPLIVAAWAATFWATTQTSLGLLINSNVIHPIFALIFIVAAMILWRMRRRPYEEIHVEVSGLYWHFVDLVWMFIFPLVYLMSTKV